MSVDSPLQTTQDELRALGERWKACPGFRWRTGVADQYGRRVGVTPEDCGFDSGVAVIVYDHRRALAIAVYTDSLWPDLSDPATRGVLLEDVREAWGDPELVPIVMRDGSRKWWSVAYPNIFQYVGQGSTEIEALVCAREAAPR